MRESQASADPAPLAGVTVLDLTAARAGPTCVRHLADWGANVIRIEPPGPAKDEEIGLRSDSDFQNLHRNKRAITLNLKDAEGHAVFMRMVETADIVIENMRPSVKHRLKVAWADVQAVNPRVVYGSISGFGQDGAYAERSGVDQIAQGMGGLMSITGLPGQGPVRVGIAINDLTAGDLLALGVMIALFDRQRTGVGRWVTTSLLESQIYMLDFQAARWLKDGVVAGQVGNAHPTGTFTGVYPSSDGVFNIAGNTPRMWARLCEGLERQEWMSKPEWATNDDRRADRVALQRAIADVTRHKPAAHWIKIFNEVGLPSGPIYSIDQVFADPQVEHLGVTRPMVHPTLGETEVVASPLSFTGASKHIRLPTPELGEHTEEVLRSYGYTAAEIAELRRKGIV